MSDHVTSQADHFMRQAVYYKNELRQSVNALVGIATGLLADRQLNDAEVGFLHEWLTTHDEVACEWPGNIVCARVKAVLADGVITEDERLHLVTTLQDLVGGNPTTLANATHVTELAFDDLDGLEFAGYTFCLTGEFVYAPRPNCEDATTQRGGIVKSAVSKKVRYLVVGSLGSQEWKHGSYGTKIDKAMQLKREGAPIRVVREDTWAAAL